MNLVAHGYQLDPIMVFMGLSETVRPTLCLLPSHSLQRLKATSLSLILKPTTKLKKKNQYSKPNLEKTKKSNIVKRKTKHHLDPLQNHRDSRTLRASTPLRSSTLGILHLRFDHRGVDCDFLGRAGSSDLIDFVGGKGRGGGRRGGRGWYPVREGEAG